MEIDLSRNYPTNRPRSWVEITLIAAFIFSLLIGIGALVLLLLSNRPDDVSLSTPALQTIIPESIVPQLAISQLAGDPAEALAYQAASAGELDTARAIALASAEFSGEQRLSLLLRLATEYLSIGRPAEAAYLFNQAQSIAILDPALVGVERINALTQVAEGFIAAEQLAPARESAVQAVRATQQTPGLLPAIRSQAYEQLRPIVNALDDSSLSQELSELARNPYYEPTGEALPAQLSDIEPYHDFSAELQESINQRRTAARVLVDRIALTAGTDIEPEVQALRAALLQEDQTRDRFYQERLSQGLSLRDQYALVLDRRNWTMLQYRIALLGFGLSLVPEWEDSQQSIAQELSADTANLNLIADAIANELADPADSAMLRAESLRWLALQAAVGLYPNASLSDLSNRIEQLQSDLANLGHPVALPVRYYEDRSPPGFGIESTR